MKTAVNWENSEFFSNAIPHAISQIKACVKEESYTALQPIFLEGDAATDLYILKSGEVELTYTLPTRQDTDVRITMIRPGELFAWSALTGGTTLTAKAFAVEESEVFTIPAKELRKIMDKSPEFGYQIMNRLAQLIAGRLKDTRTQLQWLNSF